MAKKSKAEAATVSAPATAPASSSIRDRIRELRRVPASQLLANPKNWRTHTKKQKLALRGALEEVGFVGAVLARETPRGLEIIDGHLRAETAPSSVIPVLVLDVTEDEAKVILATHDPIAEMAELDQAAFDALTAELEAESEDLQWLLDSYATESPGIAIPVDGPQPAVPPTVVFQGWSLSISHEAADLLEAKIRAHAEEHGTLLGLADRIINAVQA